MQKIGRVEVITEEDEDKGVKKRVSLRIIIDEGIVKKYHAHDTKHARVYSRARHTASQKRCYILRPLPHSLNEWSGMNNITMNVVSQRWHKFIIWLIKTQYPNYLDINLTNSYIGFTFVKIRKARWDIDNMVPKHIIDGMVQSGIFIDDNYEHVRCISLSGYVDDSVEGKKRGEFTEILIEGEPIKIGMGNGFV